MKILVCGGRNFANPKSNDYSSENKTAIDEYKFVMEKLNEIIYPLSLYYNPTDNWLPTDITIINGKAKGVDNAASDWAIINHACLKEYPADWNKYGKAAGHIRNKQMLEEEKPDLVITFPGGKGTANMKQQAEKAGIEVIEVIYDNS